MIVRIECKQDGERSVKLKVMVDSRFNQVGLNTEDVLRINFQDIMGVLLNFNPMFYSFPLCHF